MEAAFWSKTLAAAVLGVLAGCSRVPDTIRIGVAQPLSGPSAARGQDLLDGVNLAAAELNQAGYKIAGKTVRFEVVARDDKADKETAKHVAEDLVQQKVTAVIGHLSSDTTEVTIPIYRQGNVLQFFTSSAAELTKLGNGNTFRLVANDALQASAVAGYVTSSLSASTVAILYEDTAYGRPMSRDVAAALAKEGKRIRFNETVGNGTTDFKARIAKLKEEPPDVLVAVLRDNQLLPLLQQMNAAGLADTIVVSTSSSKTDKVAKAPPDVTRLYVTSSAVEAAEFLGGPAFLGKFNAAYNAKPVWAAHYAYDAVYVLADTMSRAGSVDPDVLRRDLRTIDAVAPVTSTMRFDSEGEQRYGAISVYRRRNAVWEPLMRSDKW